MDSTQEVALNNLYDNKEEQKDSTKSFGELKRWEVNFLLMHVFVA
ncbi:hypothetical protein [Borreliella americana]|nr:hypothetical protein [Borreliella americana]